MSKPLITAIRAFERVGQNHYNVKGLRGYQNLVFFLLVAVLVCQMQAKVQPLPMTLTRSVVLIKFTRLQTTEQRAEGGGGGGGVFVQGSRDPPLDLPLHTVRKRSHKKHLLEKQQLQREQKVFSLHRLS